MKGRKPKPTTLHVLEGTRNATKHRSRGTEAKPIGEITDPPADFGEAERAEWVYVVEHSPAGLLKLLDRSVLATYCRAVVAAENAWQEMSDGLSVTSTAGVRSEAPAVRTFQKMSLLALRCCEQLGFSPAARPRVHVDPEAEKSNPFASFGAARRAKAPATEPPDGAVH